MKEQETKAAPMPVVIPPRSLNPFEGERKSVVQSASGSTEVNRAVAEVQAAIMLAKQFPRSKIESVDRILVECTRVSLAEKAVYSYPKGGQEITGPSIRLAEVLAQNWGNFQFGWDELSRKNGESEILAFAWDVETNMRCTKKFFVKHWRDTKKGGYAIKEERDIYELCSNQAQRRVRSCILNAIPGDIVEAAIMECERTLQTRAPVTADSIKALLAAFEGFEVSKAQIEKRLGRKVAVDSINGAIMAQLRKIYTGLKDGMSKPEEFFEPDLTEATTELATDAPAEESSDWDSVVDEMLSGTQGCADVETLKAYLEEIGDQTEKLRKSGDKSAIKRWAEGYSKRYADLEKS